MLRLFDIARGATTQDAGIAIGLLPLSLSNQIVNSVAHIGKTREGNGLRPQSANIILRIIAI